MRFLKAFLVGAIGLFLVMTLLSLLIPSKVMVTRTVLINRSAEAIYPLVSNLREWKQWHPAFQPAVSKVRMDTGLALVSTCELEQAGKVTLIRVTKPDSNTVHFTLEAPGERPINNQLSIVPVSANQSKVDWQALHRLHWYPWEKFYAIFIDKLTGPGYESALAGLKEYAER